MIPCFNEKNVSLLGNLYQISELYYFFLLLITGDAKENRFLSEKDEYGADTMSEIHIVGRIVLNLWRVMKTEVLLTAP